LQLRHSTFAFSWPLSITAFAVLMLELILTRLFSAVLFYHYAFLVVSISLLGLATGGLVARLWKRPTDDAQFRTRLAWVCLAAAIVLLPITRLILSTNIWLVTTSEAFSKLSTLFLTCLIPFVLAGFVISSVLAARADDAPVVYAFDLFGAGLGCLAFVPTIQLLGGPNAALACSALWALAAIGWSVGSTSRQAPRAAAVLIVGLAAFVALNRDGSLLDVQFMRGVPRKAEIFAGWNSFSRVSVVQPADSTYWIEIDGGAGTWITNIEPEGVSGKRLAAVFGRTGPELAFALVKPRSSLVIGVGGGFDVARALIGGSRSVAAVEINPLIANDIGVERFAHVNRGLLRRPDVRLHIEDGRTFAGRTSDRFDVIQLSQVDTWAASASGAYALTENHLYTVEAVDEFLDKLTPEGMLSIGRWEFKRPRETLRLFATILEALERRGAAQPNQHVAVVLEDLGGSALQLGTALVKATPFTPAQVDSLGRLASAGKLRIAYAPGLDGGISPFTDLALATDRSVFLDAYEFDVSPVTDDRPFFFFTGRWKHALSGAFSFDASGDSVNTGAQFLLLGILVMAILAVALFLIGPMVLARRHFAVSRDNAALLGIGVAVGLGFILVEIALIQRYAIFLGRPAYSLTVVLFGMLVSSSLGSFVSGRISSPRLPRATAIVAVAVVLVVLAHAFAGVALMERLQGSALSVKIAVLLASIVPLGFLMGMPFPSALRLASQARGGAVEWIWALNGAASVLGSVLTIFLAVTLGLQAALLGGAICYVVAAALFVAQGVRAPDHPAHRLNQ